MKRFNIPIVAEGLTAYAIERQNGWERHQLKGAPTWAVRRRSGLAHLTAGNHSGSAEFRIRAGDRRR